MEDIRKIFLFLLTFQVYLCGSSMLEFLACGFDSSTKNPEGNAPLSKYPWLGILYYTFNGYDDERATTMAVMVRKNYALVPSFDITNIPRSTLRTNTRVVFGMDWITDDVGLHVDSYVLHPEYKVRTLNTMALVKFEDSLGGNAWPVCPPISAHPRNQSLFSIIIQDVFTLKKTVRKMVIVDKGACSEFYRKNKLLLRRVQPVSYLCAVATSERSPCVWEAGSVLATRDPWGRWRLIGFGVRGPGCGAPAKYLDMFTYLPWIERSISSEEYISVYRGAPNQLFLRQGANEPWSLASEKVQRNTFREFNQLGNCFDTERETTELYREDSIVECDAMRSIQGTYMMTITQIVNVMCVAVSTEGVHGASHPFLWVEHFCDRTADLCHIYRNTTSALKISFLFSFKMRLKVVFTGQQVPNEENDKMVALLNPSIARKAQERLTNQTLEKEENSN